MNGRWRTGWLTTLVMFCAVRCSLAQFDPPPTYYSTATGTGATLKSQLNAIIDGHTTLSYDALRTALQVTDADPAATGRMILVYDRTSLNVAAINPGGLIPGWDNAATWNREHVWPQSIGLDATTRPMAAISITCDLRTPASTAIAAISTSAGPTAVAPADRCLAW